MPQTLHLLPAFMLKVAFLAQIHTEMSLSVVTLPLVIKVEFSSLSLEGNVCVCVKCMVVVWVQSAV